MESYSLGISEFVMILLSGAFVFNPAVILPVLGTLLSMFILKGPFM